MKDEVVVPVGKTDQVQDSGSPLEDLKNVTVQEELVIPEMTPEQEKTAVEVARSIEEVSQADAAAICDTGEPIEVEPISGYYDQGETVVEVTVEDPGAGASPSEAEEVDIQGSDSPEYPQASDPVDSSEQPEGTEETAEGSSPSPNTSSATFRVAVDECPGTAEGFCSRKTLNAKWSPKNGRCEKCGVALTKAGKHRKRRNDVGSTRDEYNRSQ